MHQTPESDTLSRLWCSVHGGVALVEGGKIGTEQERRAHSVRFSCLAGGGVCARDRVETVSNTYEKHKKKGEAYCVPSWVA